MNISGLICPITKGTLTLSGDQLVTAGGSIRYRIDDGFPLLLGPEAETRDASLRRDQSLFQYAEAYKEMPFYDAEGRKKAAAINSLDDLSNSSSQGIRHLAALALDPSKAKFPDRAWLYTTVDVGAERDCYRHIGDVSGKRVLQIGGTGVVALLLLLAGAAEAVLLTPMKGEAVLATKLASILDVQDGFRCVIGVGEEIPFGDCYFDACSAGGCVHHMRTEIAFAEMARILKPGGKLAAIEPWRAPGYTLGTKIFGKREPNAFCSPLDDRRTAPLHRYFRASEISHHGTLTRYPSIVLEKFGFGISRPVAEWITDADDAICNCLPGVRQMGSGVAILGTK